jgi:hypothetical protein
LITFHSIIAIMLGRLRMNVNDSLNQFFNLSEQVFGEPKFFKGLQNIARGKYLRLTQTKYHSGKLEAVVKEAVENRAVSDLTRKTESRFKSSSVQCKWYINA